MSRESPTRERFASTDGFPTRIVTGRFDDPIVSCRRCGWRYDLHTGAVVQLPRLRRETYAVRLEGSSVMLGTTFAPPCASG